MVSALRQAAHRGELHRITRPGEIDAWLDELMSTDWVVYTKAYLSRPDTVVDYLGRYSRKTALTDRRIVGIKDNTVRLRYKDYRDQDRTKVEELIRRFLLHILPPGRMRIRHYGFLANRCRTAKLAHIRACLEVAEELSEPDIETEKNPTARTAEPAPVCPRCTLGRLIARYEIASRHTAYG
jgi:Putative transposase